MKRSGTPSCHVYSVHPHGTIPTTQIVGISTMVRQRIERWVACRPRRGNLGRDAKAEGECLTRTHVSSPDRGKSNVAWPRSKRRISNNTNIDVRSIDCSAHTTSINQLHENEIIADLIMPFPSSSSGLRRRTDPCPEPTAHHHRPP